MLIIKKDILILGKGTTQGLEHTLAAEKMYSISFTVTRKKFCLTLHYNGANSYLLINGTEIIKLESKDFEIVATPLRLENISKSWSLDNIIKQDLMVLFMILVFIMLLLQLMIFLTFISI